MRRVVLRVRDRRRVDDGVVAADDGERVAGVGEVGALVGHVRDAPRSNTGAPRSLAVTSWPASRSADTVAAPTLPREPVTRIFTA